MVNIKNINANIIPLMKLCQLDGNCMLRQTVISALAPKINVSCQILVLGNMPGAISQKEAKYYAHPRNLFWDCELDYIGDTSYEERGCGQGTFMTTMFSSCCLLLPIGFFVGMFGYNMMENQNSVTMGMMPPSGPIDPSRPNTIPQAPIPQTAAFGKALQATAVGYGVGVATIGVIIAIGAALIGILGLLLFFSY